MEPELQKQIKEWDKSLDPESAKRLLIRQGAMKAYKDDKLKEHLTEVLAEVNSMITVLQMQKAEVGILIGTLEKARMLLASSTQGIQIAYAEEEEPRIRTKRENEKLEKIKKGSKEKEDLLGGLDMSAMLIAIADMKKKKAEGNSVSIPQTPEPRTPANKYICENCKKEVLILLKNMHKC